jgi:sialate O-acetylesterase
MVALLFLLSASSALADVRLPAIFSDHMVLQAQMPIRVWGWADPGETVTVSIGQTSRLAMPGKDGRWEVMLGKLQPGGPHSLLVRGRNSITIRDVLVGEVWLGSGQSNMAMTVNRCDDFEQEARAATFPLLRMFIERSNAADKPQSEPKGEWVVCSPDAVGTFSGTLYFFGRELHTTLGAPVGLINSSVGGTPIESWISPEAQKKSKALKPLFDAQAAAEAKFDAEAARAQHEKALERWKEAAAKAKADGKAAPRKPQDPIALRERKGNVGGLFNGKIAPLIPYTIRGAVWYQGEANTVAEKAAYYQHHLPLLVQDWRERWGYTFPFAWVQLPNYIGAGRDWPTVREAMLKTLSLPATGMAITMDIGDPKDIHPKNKQDVGKRLAMWALATVYGRKDVAASGPIADTHKVAGGRIEITFKHAHGGLQAKGGELKGFEIAGEDKAWKPAEARIDGDRVIVSGAEVKKPVAVRYAWENNPECNLFNGAGLPASPFRTKEW